MNFAVLDANGNLLKRVEGDFATLRDALRNLDWNTIQVWRTDDAWDQYRIDLRQL